VLVAHLPRREVTAAEREAVVHGRPIAAQPGSDARSPIALFAGGELVAVAEALGAVLKPRVVVTDA
jgi:hypothetical protein